MFRKLFLTVTATAFAGAVAATAPTTPAEALGGGLLCDKLYAKHGHARSGVKARGGLLHRLCDRRDVRGAYYERDARVGVKEKRHRGRYMKKKHHKRLKRREAPRRAPLK